MIVKLYELMADLTATNGEQIISITRRRRKAGERTYYVK